MTRIYPWTHADLVAHDELLQHKRLYLNTPFFLVRAAIYFAVWNAISYFLNAWSLEQDRTGNPLLRAAHAAVERRRSRHLRRHHHIRVVRLDDVARAALVLDNLRRADHGWTGAVVAGVPDHRARVAQPPRAARSHRRAGALPRSRQPDARVRDALGVLLVLAVPDHLGRQPAARDHVVSAPDADGVAADRNRADAVPLRGAVRRAAVPHGQAASRSARPACGRRARCAPRRSVLAHRARVPSRWHRRQLDGYRAAVDDRRAVGRRVRVAAARPCDSALSTIPSSTRRSAASSSAARRRERRTDHGGAASAARRTARRGLDRRGPSRAERRRTSPASSASAPRCWSRRSSST